MKLYKLFWTHEGFCWRRGDFQIHKPKKGVGPWKLRLVGGKAGKQLSEHEGDHYSERTAFKAGNKAIRESKKK